MATFSQEVKTEIARNAGTASPCCRTAFLSGLIRTAGSITLRRGGMGFVLSGENLQVLKTAARFIGQLYDEEPELVEETVRGRNRVRYCLNAFNGERILSDCGIVAFDEHGLRQIRSVPDAHLAEQPCCAQAFLKAVFLGAGFVTLPGEKNKEGYHLEFAFSEAELATAVEEIARECGFACKKILRKKETVLYLKGSEEISDILVFLGANKCVFRLQNTIAERSLRNRANRQTNCISANIDKTLNAAERQIASINIIESSGRLQKLPKTLIDAALLRKAHPSESLDELAAISNEPVTKSGLNHRFRRINEIAAEIQAEVHCERGNSN